MNTRCVEERVLLRVLFAANRNGRAVRDTRGRGGRGVSGGECVRRGEWARGSSWHARSTWLRAGSPPRPDPRDFQDIRHTREGRRAQGSTNSNPSPSSSPSTSCVVPFRLDAKLSTTGLTCTLNNRRYIAYKSRRRRSGIETHPCRE